MSAPIARAEESNFACDDEPARWLATCLPGGVHSTLSPIDCDDSALLEEERKAVRRARPGRRHEFATGRRCAREALTMLGEGGVPLSAPVLMPNAHRSVDWPAGIVGSISHSDELCVAAVAEASTIAALGVDLEPRLPLEENLWTEIALPAELRAAGIPDTVARGEFAKLVFSAKESVFKCVHPTWKQWLDFQDVTLSVHFESESTGAFRAALSQRALERAAGPPELRGRFALSPSCIFTAAWIDGRGAEGSALR